MYLTVLCIILLLYLYFPFLAKEASPQHGSHLPDHRLQEYVRRHEGGRESQSVI